MALSPTIGVWEMCVMTAWDALEHEDLVRHDNEHGPELISSARAFLKALNGPTREPKPTSEAKEAKRRFAAALKSWLDARGDYKP